MTPSPEKKCLVILGMHRSGTSALSGALNLAGFNPGNELFIPEEDNPKGNFENARITMLNERILDELYAKWNDTLLIPDDWWKFDLLENYLERILHILKEEFSSGAPVLIKDPRLSVLLPLYLKAFEQLAIRPRFIISTRNPLEIIQSLIRRNHLSREKSLLLWMDYQLKAELYTRDFERIFLSYHQFLNDPIRSLSEIRKKVAEEIQLTPETKEKIIEFLDKDLKHHNLQGQLPESEASPELLGLYQILGNTSLRDLDPSETAQIDGIRHKFYAMFRFYNGLSHPFEAILHCTVPNSKPVILKAKVGYGKHTLNFSLGATVPVSKLVFKPSNSRVGLKIQHIQLTKEGGEKLIMSDFNTNAGYQAEDGTLVFETEMPEIVLDFSSPIEMTELNFDLVYLTFGRTAYRMGVRHKKQELLEIQSQLNSVEEQRLIINNQLQSLTGELALMQKKFIEAEQDIRNKETALIRKEEELHDKNQEITIKLEMIQSLESELNVKIKALSEANQVIDERSREVELLQARVRSLESSVQAILDSLTWKSGRVITYPARIAYDLFKPKKQGK